jgi:hypothetical protein
VSIAIVFGERELNETLEFAGQRNVIHANVARCHLSGVHEGGNTAAGAAVSRVDTSMSDSYT